MPTFDQLITLGEKIIIPLWTVYLAYRLRGQGKDVDQAFGKIREIQTGKPGLVRKRKLWGK